jgi:hypothetical protein
VSTTVCTTTFATPADCASAITRTDKATAAVIWFLAAFVPEATPSVASVYFGISFDDVNLDPSTKFGFCGPAGSAEAPDAGWPANNAGNSVGFATAIVGNHLFPVYYFKVDEFSGTAGPSLCSAINPTGGFAKFYDDAFPPVEDPITRFGCVKWYDATGSNTCPVPPPTGACCVISSATCQIVGSKNECDAITGNYLGDNTVCDKPCSACCYWFGDPLQRLCTVTTQSDCETGAWNDQKYTLDGNVIGANWAWVPADATVGAMCAAESGEHGTKWFCEDPRDPVVNPPTATAPVSWGKLKALYR